jgi:hypothetical protein
VFAAIIVLLSLGAVGLGGSYPTPAPVPVRWELEFKPGELRMYQDSQTGAYYWYFTYLISNRTDSKQIWAPTFTLFNELGEITVSGKNVPTRIVRDLMDLLRNKLLEDQNQIIGDILQGPENAKEGLVVWPAANPQVNEISMFVAGISGESARVHDPKTGNEVILRKTLQRDYVIPGDATARGGDPVKLNTETWVMR